jgi:rhodanese-related sulfurtransferase
MRILPLSLFALGVLLFQACRLGSQDVPARLKTSYEPLNDRLRGLVTADSLALSPREARQLTDPIYVDTREAEEYAVSHLPGAVHLGYSDPDFSVLEGVDAARPLVLYCTVGYRSERMASELRQRGFSRVYNLYGSLYAWKLAGLPLRDGNGFTERMHTYNRKWGTYIPDSLGTKVH